MWHPLYKKYRALLPIAGAVIGVLLAVAYDSEHGAAGDLLVSKAGAELHQQGRQVLQNEAVTSSKQGIFKHGMSFSNLWQNDHFERQFFDNAEALVLMMIVMFITILVILVLVNLLSTYIIPYYAPQFADLDLFGQLAVTTNMTYSLLCIVELLPYTVLMIGILFGKAESREYTAFGYAIFVFLTTHAVMYTYEGIVRGIVKVNYLLLIHHAGFFTFCILDFFIKTNFVVKVGLIFDYFVSWEAGLYFTNVLYRLNANYTLLKWTMIIGTTVHGVTHLLQAMLLTAFFVGMGKRMDRYDIHVAIFVVYVILSYSLIVYQFYLEKIFYEMWLKIAAKQRKKEAAAAYAADETDVEKPGLKDGSGNNANGVDEEAAAGVLPEGAAPRKSMLLGQAPNLEALPTVMPSINTQSEEIGLESVFPRAMATATRYAKAVTRFHKIREAAAAAAAALTGTSGAAVHDTAAADAAAAKKAAAKAAKKEKKKEKGGGGDGLTAEDWAQTED